MASLPKASSLDAAVTHLQGPSDEHRVVGLLMLTKHVQIHSSNNDQIRSVVSNALDPAFLRRLLVTQQKIGDAATDSLAVGLLSFFCQDAALAASYVDTFPAVFQLWCRAVTTLETTTADASLNNVTTCQSVIDAASCILSFLSLEDTSEAASTRVQAAACGTVNACLRTTLVLDRFAPEQRPRVEQLSTDVTQRCFPVASGGGGGNSGVVPIVPIDPILVGTIADGLCNGSGESSLCCLHVLSLLCRLHVMDETMLGTSDGEKKEVASKVRRGVERMLRVKKLFERERNDCLLVCETLMEVRSAWWSKTTKADDAVLLTQLVCVEIRLLMDTLGRLLVDEKAEQESGESTGSGGSGGSGGSSGSSGSGGSSNDGESDGGGGENARAAERGTKEEMEEEMEDAKRDKVTLERALDVFPTCLSLVERAVHGLCSLGDEEESSSTSTTVWLRLGSSQILALRDSLVTAMKDLIAFIKYVASEPPAFHSQYEDGMNTHAQVKMFQLRNVIGACLRTVSLWLLVDVDSIEIEITEIVRHVLRSPCLPGFHPESIEYFVGPGLVQLLHSESVRSELYECNGHVTLLEQLRRRVSELGGGGGERSESSSMESVQSVESILVAATAVLQACTVLITQHGPTDAYVFEQVSEFVPSFQKIIRGDDMKQIVREVVVPMVSVSENAQYMMELLHGLGMEKME